MSRPDITAALERHGAIAVIRIDDSAKLHTLVDALIRGGIRVVEVTLTVPNAIAMIASLTRVVAPDVIIGAGTVLDAEIAARAIDAGAHFVVSPVFRPAVLETCRHRGVTGIPGCYSPTEILNAWDAGADMVKVFPATSLGPTYIRDLLAPLPLLKLVPTGGVTVDQAGDWIRAGAAAVGLGGALVDARAIAAGDFAAITRTAQRLVSNVRAAREPSA